MNQRSWRTLLAIVLATSALPLAHAEPLPTPHGAAEVQKFLRDRKSMQAQPIAVVALVESMRRDEKGRPVCKIRLRDYAGPLWAVFIIQAPSVKPGSILRVMGFLSERKAINPTGLAELRDDPCILVTGYADQATKEAAHAPGAEKDWADWMRGKVPAPRGK